ncbi:YwaF family protein [Mycoplasma sp. Mirounga ES2805-ORL]|uniref:TMEM164 family acyltransferase n=1 Tax=Mycoplasma sp. Mirounga ES2805-ORL TaxID=754514 RepID=UPI00197B2803|nr:YwaF family protein [Mycoplasma sp. Mirounga ES2805-ORL]QSF13534.1 YwaF family protein [Mycoplasma sp. Mirounga ES2805-ORL]
MYEFIKYLSKEWDRPKLFGAMHISFLVASIIIIALMVIFIKTEKMNVSKIKILVGIIFLILFTVEVLKQLLAIGVIDDSSRTWTYKIYSNPSYIPFQLCSTPLYAIPLYLCVTDKKVGDAILSYIGIFGLWMGAFVMFYPGDVFNENIFICFHTMIYHSLLFILGSFLTIKLIIKYHWKEYLFASIIFLIFYLIAVAGNEFIYQFKNRKSWEWLNGLNLFNMSHRQFTPMLNGFKSIASKMPNYLWTILYVPFTLIGVFVVWTMFALPLFITQYVKKKNRIKKEIDILKHKEQMKKMNTEVVETIEVPDFGLWNNKKFEN